METNAIEFLETKDKTYDLIIGLDIIEHFKKSEVLQYLDACFNALKPNGWVYPPVAER
ncbi:MAG: class I SAM-dependent methyltransferase [Planctomycetes bacterium]|nr:class I SAM-dependent methyltransferase [Planctomycetota bacterium]